MGRGVRKPRSSLQNSAANSQHQGKNRRRPSGSLELLQPRYDREYRSGSRLPNVFHAFEESGQHHQETHESLGLKLGDRLHAPARFGVPPLRLHPCGPGIASRVVHRAWYSRAQRPIPVHPLASVELPIRNRTIAADVHSRKPATAPTPHSVPVRGTPTYLGLWQRPQGDNEIRTTSLRSS